MSSVTLLGDMPKVRRTSAVAHALTLQARALVFSGEGDAYDKARVLLEEALRQDPDYVPALYYLSAILYWKASYAHPFDPAKFEENDRLANELDNRALQIDPDHPNVLSMQGWTNFEINKDFQMAANLIERAVQAAPGDVEVLRIAAGFARRIGHTDQAIELAQLEEKLDPLCRGCSHG